MRFDASRFAAVCLGVVRGKLRNLAVAAVVTVVQLGQQLHG